jgi:hypothetical protein
VPKDRKSLDEIKGMRSERVTGNAEVCKLPCLCRFLQKKGECRRNIGFPNSTVRERPSNRVRDFSVPAPSPVGRCI